MWHKKFAIQMVERWTKYRVDKKDKKILVNLFIFGGIGLIFCSVILLYPLAVENLVLWKKIVFFFATLLIMVGGVHITMIEWYIKNEINRSEQ